MADNHEHRVRFAMDELVVNGNLEVVEDVFAGDYIAHAGGKDHHGHAFLRRFAKQLRKAIPDLGVKKITFLLQAGDMLAWERTLSGTHEADLMGIPPTGKKVVWSDMMVTRFEGEQIAEEWMVSDLAGQLFSKFSKPEHRPK